MFGKKLRSEAISAVFPKQAICIVCSDAMPLVCSKETSVTGEFL